MNGIEPGEKMPTVVVVVVVVLGTELELYIL